MDALFSKLNFTLSPMSASNMAASTSTTLYSGQAATSQHTLQVPSKKPRSKPTKNREPVKKIAVECGPHKGMMHLDRFQGSKSKAQFIELPDWNGNGSSKWITAKDFAAMNEKLKDWKQYIRHGKWNLRKLENLRYLILEIKDSATCTGCICPDCCPGRRQKRSKKPTRKSQVKKDRTRKSSPSKSLPIHIKNLAGKIVQSSPLIDYVVPNIAQSRIAQSSNSVDTTLGGAITSRAAVSTSFASSQFPITVNVEAPSTEGVPRRPHSSKLVSGLPAVVSHPPVARVSPKYEKSSDFVVYFTTARDIDVCQIAMAFPDISDIVRWPNERFLIYRKHMPFYLLDLTRALGAKRDVARAKHLIYDLQPADVGRYEMMNRLSCSLDELVREIEKNVKKLNDLAVRAGNCVKYAELRKIPWSGQHVEILLSMHLSKAIDPFTSTIQPPLPEEISVWDRDVELQQGGLQSKCELERLKCWMTKRLSYGNIWIEPEDQAIHPSAELIGSMADKLRRVPLPTDPKNVRKVICFIRSVDTAVKSRTDYVRQCVSSLVSKARDKIRSSMMSTGWTTMSLFVVVDVGPDIGLTTLRQIADDEVLDKFMLTAFVGVDVQKQRPTCAVLHLEVKLPDEDILKSCFSY